MKGFSKLNIKSAVKSNSKMDLSCSHMTTMNFGDLVPIHIQDCLVGDSINLKADSFMRLAPMVVPTFGNLGFKTASVFVPYRTVFDDADAFFGGSRSDNGHDVVVPQIYWSALYALFFDLSSGIPTQEGYVELVDPDESYDILYHDQDNDPHYYRFTPDGKRVYKILRSLGYSMPSISPSHAIVTDSIKVNALPILCYAKAYNDWFSQSAKMSNSSLTRILHEIKTSANHFVTDENLRFILSNMPLLYDDDYFTTAWQSPNSVISGTNFNHARPTGGLNGSEISGTINGTERYDSLTPVGNIVSQRALDYLSQFDKFVRRNNYSGSRAVERVLARFGIKPSDYRSAYSELINTSSSPIQIGDIMSNAQTGEGVNGELGSYAGKGIMSDTAAYSYKCSDFGMMITFAWLAIRPFYPKGCDRNVLKTSYSDFYVPEYDGLGASPIVVAELGANPKDNASTAPLNVFGFTERYNDYRYGKDRVTGDFELYEDMSQWTLGRDTDAIVRGLYKAQSAQFMNIVFDGNQYNRMFTDTNSDVDHFYLTTHFDVNMKRPMMNLNEVPQLGEGDTTISRNGAQLS